MRLTDYQKYKILCYKIISLKTEKEFFFKLFNELGNKHKTDLIVEKIFNPEFGPMFNDTVNSLEDKYKFKLLMKKSITEKHGQIFHDLIRSATHFDYEDKLQLIKREVINIKHKKIFLKIINRLERDDIIYLNLCRVLSEKKQGQVFKQIMDKFSVSTYVE